MKSILEKLVDKYGKIQQLIFANQELLRLQETVNRDLLQHYTSKYPNDLMVAIKSFTKRENKKIINAIIDAEIVLDLLKIVYEIDDAEVEKGKTIELKRFENSMREV